MAGDLIIVDIQPEYAKNITFDVAAFVDWAFVQNDFDSVTYLFNGPNLGMSDKGEIIEWLIQQYMEATDDYDQHESLYWAMKRADWHDKGYGFFRDVMDEGFDDADIISMGKHMIATQNWDVRDFDEDDWATVNVDGGLQEHLQDEGLAFYMPDALFELQPLQRPILAGGGVSECLREIQLILEMLNRPYTTYSPFTY